MTNLLDTFILAASGVLGIYIFGKAYFWIKKTFKRKDPKISDRLAGTYSVVTLILIFVVLGVITEIVLQSIGVK